MVPPERNPDFMPSCVHLITDMNHLQHVLTMGVPIVSIAENNDPYLVNNPNIIPAPILMPDYAAVSAFIDGRPDGAQIMYYQYLSTPHCQEYIQIILAAAVLNTRPIFLLFDNDEMAMNFAFMFITYLADVYGFWVGFDPAHPSGFVRDARYNNLLALLYMNGYLKDPCSDILFRLVGDPGTDMVNPALIQRLADDMKPIVSTPSYGEYVDYFRSLMEQMRMAGKPLYDPMEAI